MTRNSQDNTHRNNRTGNNHIGTRDNPIRYLLLLRQPISERQSGALAQKATLLPPLQLKEVFSLFDPLSVTLSLNVSRETLELPRRFGHL